ncbi:hypothetical protein QBC35DRAFT_430725 [Podospora australis]|uniref:Uncharacterized protein n=1 Tax=Podospora australis TaxID=1536484 RepID=A0AAN6WWK8_9PEZI|nr:hypothetical protein QBC35DRAFT_430725 [Podospora australis]
MALRGRLAHHLVWSTTTFYLTIAFLASTTSAHAAVPNTPTSPQPFPMSQVSLLPSRWQENENRTLNYLKSVSLDRLLYNFRLNHRLSTQNAAPNRGWDAPDFPFRTHMQGHFLSAWAYCYASTRDEVCRSRAIGFVAELAKCQANNPSAGFSPGYLSGFPESEFTALEQRTLKNGNVPYYAVHKTMAGLLDVWRLLNSTQARDVLLAMAGWVDVRTAKLSYAPMQAVLGTEFGGMNDILADLSLVPGQTKWLAVAQRFDHAAVFDPLAANKDQLSGLHANTQVPKWIGAAKSYSATGTARYFDIAHNAWKMTVQEHTYAIGGNSQAEHFRPPGAIAGYLGKDTAEGCNTYNMLKLTRELFSLDSAGDNGTGYFDYYEHALLNHLLGQQNAGDKHGHITYFTPLNPGAKRGVGPAWGGGTWSTDYDSFWCCQGTGLETNTKLMDSIYFFSGEDKTLWVNLFTPSVLKWEKRGVVIRQETSYPVNDTTRLTVEGKEGSWELRVRIPGWTSGAEIQVNGVRFEGVVRPGQYAVIKREWKAGDMVTVQLPMKLRLLPANDNPNLAALAYGPVVLAGNSSSTTMPTLALGSLRRVGNGLEFTATAGGKTVRLGAFYEAWDYNYNVYWAVSGSLPGGV